MKQQSLPRSYLTELRGREFKGIAPLSQPKAETFLQQKFLFTTTLNFAKVSMKESKGACQTAKSVNMGVKVNFIGFILLSNFLHL